MSGSFTMAAIQAPPLSTVDAYRMAPGYKKLNRRQLAKARTVAKVKEAARFLFVNVGYEATTIRDLAARIGMSTGAVFASFENKDAIWTEVMGSPPPSIAVAEEIALLVALRPDWKWLLKFDGRHHVAQVQHPDYNPLNPGGPGPSYVGRAWSPAEALRQARQAADKGSPLAAS